MITLDLQSRLPIYEQLKSQISQLILSGDLKGDDQLPSIRNFARELGINPNTVQKAYQDLETDGLIYSVPGRGSYINPNPSIRTKLIQEEKNSLSRATRQAKNAGVTQQDALEIVTTVYQEEESEA